MSLRRTIMSTVLLCGAIWFPALATASPQAASVRFWNGARAVSRPLAMSYTGDGTGELIRVRWSSFGGPTAIARATDRANDCRPSCAGGSWHESAVRIRLSRPIACRGHVVYSSLVISDPSTPALGGRRPLFTPCTP